MLRAGGLGDAPLKKQINKNAQRAIKETNFTLKEAFKMKDWNCKEVICKREAERKRNWKKACSKCIIERMKVNATRHDSGSGGSN